MQFSIYEPITMDFYATATAAGVSPSIAQRYESNVRQARPVVFRAFYGDSAYDSNLSAAANIIRLLCEIGICRKDVIDEKDGEIYDMAYRMHKTVNDIVAKVVVEANDWLFVPASCDELARVCLEMLDTAALNGGFPERKSSQQCTVELF